MTTIRPATLDDIELINRLALDSFCATYRDILSPEQLDYMFDMMYLPSNIELQMTRDAHRYFIASYDGEECGYLSIEQQEESLFHLQKIYLIPKFQGKGIGRELIEFAFSYVSSIISPCTLELNVNRNNKAKLFYEKMGMSVARSGDYDIGNGYYMCDFIMSITL